MRFVASSRHRLWQAPSTAQLQSPVLLLSHHRMSWKESACSHRIPPRCRAGSHRTDGETVFHLAVIQRREREGFPGFSLGRRTSFRTVPAGVSRGRKVRFLEARIARGPQPRCASPRWRLGDPFLRLCHPVPLRPPASSRLDPRRPEAPRAMNSQPPVLLGARPLPHAAELGGPGSAPPGAQGRPCRPRRPGPLVAGSAGNPIQVSWYGMR